MHYMTIKLHWSLSAKCQRHQPPTLNVLDAVLRTLVENHWDNLLGGRKTQRIQHRLWYQVTLYQNFASYLVSLLKASYLTSLSFSSFNCERELVTYYFMYQNILKLLKLESILQFVCLFTMGICPSFLPSLLFLLLEKLF